MKSMCIMIRTIQYILYFTSSKLMYYTSLNLDEHNFINLSLNVVNILLFLIEYLFLLFFSYSSVR